MGASKEIGDFEKLPGVRLYKGDRARLEQWYPKAGYNKIIRRLVSEHLAKLDAKFEQRISARDLEAKPTLTPEDLT